MFRFGATGLRLAPRAVWMAPTATNFNKMKDSSKFTVSSAAVEPEFFGPIAENKAAVPPTTIVVSAQPVTKEFLSTWKMTTATSALTLVRRGTSLGSIDLVCAKELGIKVINTPGVNSPHVAKFLMETLKLKEQEKKEDIKAVVFGAGSVGRFVIEQMNAIGVTPFVVDPQISDVAAVGGADKATLCATTADALEGATHIAICCATSGDKPILDLGDVGTLLGSTEQSRSRGINIVCISRPEAFSMEAIAMMPANVNLHFDYGATVLQPVKDVVNKDGEKSHISWSSVAMASEACKEDMDAAVFKALA